jgi:uncharacterized protein YmfQ (DUF2313 family)
MDLTVRYELLLAQLLPRGPAWDNENNALLKGLAPSLSVVHKRSDDLMREIDPRRTSELIDRYEAITGLPDSCAPPGVQTLTQRQQRLDAKISVIGGINVAFYLAQLEALGYPDATITTFNNANFRCNSPCTAALYSDVWRYYWQVFIPTVIRITSMTCTSSCTSALRFWGDTVAECVIEKLTPSHTVVIFRYPNAPAE